MYSVPPSTEQLPSYGIVKEIGFYWKKGKHYNAVAYKIYYDHCYYVTLTLLVDEVKDDIKRNIAI